MFEFPDGSRYELDLSNPAHREWMNKKAGGVQPSAPAQEKPPTDYGSELLRQVGLTARAGVKGLASLPGVVVDPITGFINAVAGSKIPTTASSVDWALSGMGLPEPKDATERVVGDMAGAMAGTGGMIKGAQAASKGASPVVQKILQAMQEAPKLQAVSSATSAGAGGVVRENDGGPVAQWVASILGGMAPAVGASVAVPTARLVGSLKDRFTQAGRNQAKADLVRGVAGDKRQLVANALSEARPKVQGMDYDAALAAEPAGSTEFSALSRALQKRYTPTVLKDLEDSNAAARLGEVGKIAGKPGDLDWAKDLRSSTGDLLYGEAFKKKVAGDPELARLFRNPFLRKAWEEAGDLNSAQKLTLKDDLLRMLQNTKLSIDKMLAANAKTPLGAAEQREAVRAQKALVDWMEKKSPDFQQARTAYAEQSRPINRMQLGETLRDKLSAPLDESERAGVFAQAMRDAPRTLKTSTGSNRYEDIAQVLLPRQVKSLENVQAELIRNRAVQQQASAGESAATGAVSSRFASVEPPPFLEKGVTLLRAVLEKTQRKATNRTLMELAQEMRSPEKLAALLKQFPEKDHETIKQALTRINIAAALGTGVGSSQE